MAIKKHNYLDRMKEGRRTGDLKILKQIINDSSRWKCETMRLNEKLFEKTFNLKALRKKPVTKELLKRELDYERVTKEITTYMMPLIPAGSTLREQVESLLPTKLTMSEERRGDANSLSYIFCRMITERVPKRTRLPVVVPGLDCLSAAILSIYYASSTVDQKLPWLFLLW